MATGIDSLKSIFAKQKEAFAANPYPGPEERISHLDAVIGMLVNYRGRIHEAFRSDFGCHPNLTADFVEIFGQVGRAEYNKAMLAHWMSPSERDTDPAMFGQSKAYVLRQPKGVVGNMSAFNFPFDLTVGPLCDMLAAGNNVIIKPSELTPACSALLDEMINVTFDQSKVAVIQGEVETAKAFAAMPWDHLLYTGNPEIAKQVAHAAAENLVPLTLELGGKSPTIFAEDSVTEDAVASLLRAKMVKNGQMCVAPDYALVPREKVAEFVDIAQNYMANAAADYVASEDITGIINERHFARIDSLLENIDADNIVQLTRDSDKASRRMAMTLVLDPPENSDLLKEEIFGPILPVIPYDALDDALDYIKSRERPLGLYMYTAEDAIKQRVIEATQSGGVTINGAALHAALPSMGFGGTGNSGYGRHHGIEGFNEFTNPRGILDLDKKAPVVNIFPPYGEAADAILAAALGGE